jgi:hypothetical protein
MTEMPQISVAEMKNMLYLKLEDQLYGLHFKFGIFFGEIPNQDIDYQRHYDQKIAIPCSRAIWKYTGEIVDLALDAGYCMDELFAFLMKNKPEDDVNLNYKKHL